MLVPSLDEEAVRLLSECIRSNYVSTAGPFVSEFESGFALWLRGGGAVACNSGTSAIHLALAAMGIGPESDVLVSDLTFVATANAIAYCGARPVLVDSEARTWNIDPALVAEELSRRSSDGAPQPGAVLVVHLLSHPAAMDEIMAACAPYNVPVVEDAAEALGAGWSSGPLVGSAAGTVGVAGCFSFNGNKTLTTGAGGLVTSRNEKLLARARHLSQQARVPGDEYLHDAVGFNYRMSNLAAAVGLSQLRRLDELLQSKRTVTDRYDRAFADVPGLVRPPARPGSIRAAWLYAIRFESRAARDRARLDLAAIGIEARNMWRPIHEHRPYSCSPRLGGHQAQLIADTVLCLPSSASLSAADQNRVIARIIDSIS
jgi:dTDP-4-amino-4,6-dideoxygalactose transaminase